MEQQDIRFAWIVFVDLIDSSAFADVLGVEDHYLQVLKPYHEVAEEVFKELSVGYAPLEVPALAEHTYYKSIRGDEVIGVFASVPAFEHSVADERRSLFWSAMRLALRLKCSWLTAQFNADRIRGQRSPLDVAIGLHCGHLLWRPKYEGGEGHLAGVESPEGFALAYCKRVESAARQVGDSRMALSPEAETEARECGVPSEFLRRFETGALKGLSGITHVYGFGSPDAAVLSAGCAQVYALPAKGVSFRTLISNVVDGYPSRGHHPNGSNWNFERKNEGHANPSIRDVVLQRLPILRKAEELVTKGEDWQAREVPNRESVRSIRERFYATPESMRLAFAIEAFYQFDREGCRDTELTAPFGWYVESVGDVRRYDAGKISHLISGALGDRQREQPKPHDLFSFRQPHLESYQIARIVFRYGAICADVETLGRWIHGLERYPRDKDVIGNCAIDLTLAAMRARVAAGMSPIEKLRPEQVIAALSEEAQKAISAARLVLQRPEEHQEHWTHWSRPIPCMRGFAAWVGWIIGWDGFETASLRTALESYRELAQMQKQVVLRFPGWLYTEENFDTENGWHAVPIASRNEVDWRTGDLVRMRDLVKVWETRLEKLKTIGSEVKEAQDENLSKG